MIRYDLACARGHAFDAWFRSSADYDTQAARGLLSCPMCGSAEVEKALMAPAVSTSRRRASTAVAAQAEAAVADTPAPAAAPAEPVAVLSEHDLKLRAMVRRLRAELTAKATDVGDRFADEARKMHYGEADRTSIYGRATPDEARALVEEGIEFHPLPGLPDERN
jgi:hypothetical protein